MAHKAKHTGPTPDPSEGLNTGFSDYQLDIGRNDPDALFGTGRMDIAFGRGGNDYLLGAGGDDDLQGGRGRDYLIGGDGRDHLDGGAGSDVLIGGGGADALRGGDDNAADLLIEGDGHGDIEGGSGNDVLVGGRGADAFVVDRNSGRDVILDFQAGPGMFDHLAMRGISPEELRFQDTPVGVRISWNGGEASVLLSGVFKAALAGDDFMFTDDRQAIQPTGASAQTVSAESFVKDEGGTVSAPNPGSGTAPSEAYAFDDFNVRVGTTRGDTFLGTEDRDYSFGLAGNDRLLGGAGDDDLRGDEGNDILDGGVGQDHLMGGAGSDSLFGGGEADNLMGGEGNDTIYGGAGHDMIEGEGGNDVLHGGDGADAFIVAHNSGNDVVIGGFDAGPGAFDHIAFKDISPDEVTVTEAGSTHGDGHSGVLVSWGDGSIFLEGLTKARMAQDDFMFNADLGTRGAFIDDPEISAAGSQLIFGEDGSQPAAANPAYDYLLG
ncbi:calcium-binding protein [Paeniroseomonas aquatica]|uniref:Calcium-binding protein n=1 Tax=Paeniroseomonas aquatica TaxID=373043 RepID=A0ABT7ZZG8_9PROT|nr:calcium-binding protein [Paeniroseomonas aquatica]MDN3562865.1 calcium-binding protein [Paeniroseomonas aquatica]